MSRAATAISIRHVHCSQMVARHDLIGWLLVNDEPAKAGRIHGCKGARSRDVHAWIKPACTGCPQFFGLRRKRNGDHCRRRRLQVPDHRGLGEIARQMVVQGGRRGRHRRQGQCLCLQSRRPSGHGLRPRRQVSALVGRGPVSARPRRPYGAGRFDLSDRRRRPFRAQMLARRQGAARIRRARQAQALYERRAVSPLHPHRTVAEGRDLRLGRLRQRQASTNIRPTANC